MVVLHIAVYYHGLGLLATMFTLDIRPANEYFRKK